MFIYSEEYYIKTRFLITQLVNPESLRCFDPNAGLHQELNLRCSPPSHRHLASSSW